MVLGQVGAQGMALVGCGSAVPAISVSNQQLSERVDTSDEWITERTGIRERRIASPEETTAGLATAAARRILDRAGTPAEAVDLIVIATATPEQPVPQTAAFVADALGVHCGALDLGAGCAGFVYGLVVGASAIAGGTFERVLVVGAETLSRIVDPADRATIEEEHALELRTRDRERKLLKKIDQSIARIDAGDYGYCDETGEPIGVGRLLARPTATLSLEAQQRRELKQKMFGD